MTSSPLADLLEEFVEQVVGPRLQALLHSVVEATAPSYPASEYNPSGVWNEDTIQDVAHDWITERLLDRGDLGPILASARSDSALRAILTRSFTQHLINRRARSSATNLFDRMVQTLKRDFICVSDPGTVGERRWQRHNDIATDATEAINVDIRRLIVYAGRRTDSDLGVVRYGPFSLKSSPILRANQLTELLSDLMGEAGGPISTDQVFTVLRHRFNLITLAPADLHQIVGESATRVVTDLRQDSDPAHESAVAKIVAARLTQRQCDDLRAVSGAENIADAVRDTGRPRAELVGSLEMSMALIADYAQSIDEARRVHQLIIESLYEWNETS